MTEQSYKSCFWIRPNNSFCSKCLSSRILLCNQNFKSELKKRWGDTPNKCSPLKLGVFCQTTSNVMCNVETNYSYANWFTHFFLEDCVNQNKLHTQWNGVNWFIIIAFSEFRHHFFASFCFEWAPTFELGQLCEFALGTLFSLRYRPFKTLSYMGYLMPLSTM